MTPTHAISADEARRLLAEDRDKAARSRCLPLGWENMPHVQWMTRAWTEPGGFRITPGWVDRSAFPEIPDWNFEARE